MKKHAFSRLIVGVALAISATVGHAGAIHDSGLFTNVLPPNDDGSTGLVNLGFTANINSTNFTQTYVNNNGNITFTNLTSKATIRVYTISGELVKTLDKNDGANDLVWTPVANESGEGLASGVYLYCAESAGGPSKAGKLMVIK